MTVFRDVWGVDLCELTIGFLGCGKISSAMCKGLAGLQGDQRPKKVLVSRRSEEKSRALSVEFPSLVEVVDDNADIVRNSDIVFIGLLPAVARAELPQMPFECNQLVISMMAAVGYEETLELTRVDASRLVRTVPLPSAARRCGPIVTFPPHSKAESFLSLLGTPTPCKTEEQMKPMIAQTGHISSFFELMRVSQHFLTEQGIDESTARAFVTSFYCSLAQGSTQAHESLEEMRDEAATPGGLNEQSVGFLRNSPHFDLHWESLDAILARLTGKR